ncbi:MAG: hypothetical protein Kow0059_11030 [Candidatus Sumerlaeia bacterium]
MPAVPDIIPLGSVETGSPEATLRLAASLGRAVSGGEVLALEGALGAGKTLFTRGLASGMGVAEPVVSPTFLLVRSYQGRAVRLHHFDFYRLTSAADLETFGFDEYFEPGAVCVIEWADRLPGSVPQPCLRVRITPLDDMRRRFGFAAAGGRPAPALLEALSAAGVRSP